MRAISTPRPTRDSAVSTSLPGRWFRNERPQCKWAQADHGPEPTEAPWQEVKAWMPAYEANRRSPTISFADRVS
jgi:hypothetical protein